MIRRLPHRAINDLCTILRADPTNSSRESLLLRRHALQSLCRRSGWFGGPVPDVTLLRRGVSSDCTTVRIINVRCFDYSFPLKVQFRVNLKLQLSLSPTFHHFVLSHSSSSSTLLIHHEPLRCR